MGTNRKNRIGQKFGRLLIIDQIYKNYQAYAICMCDCGNKKEIYIGNLVSGKIVSCGCYCKENSIKLGKQSKKHGHTVNGKRSRTYRSWDLMKQRCNNLNDDHYKDYGGRGIKVCDRWLEPKNGFINFLKDMGPCPGKEYSIDRIDNNGNYCPENCRWATAIEQGNNRRSNRYIYFNGRIETLASWVRILNISRSKLLYRLTKNNWNMEVALFEMGRLDLLFENPSSWEYFSIKEKKECA